MSDKPPFRTPCGGSTTGTLYFGNPFQHSVGPLLVDRLANITTVPNPDAEAGGTVPPYERYHQNSTDADNCEVNSCIVDGPAPCARWLLPYADNEFHADGTQVDFSLTRKKGFKVVHAKRYWNGVFGYMNFEAGGGPDHVDGCGDSSQVSWRGYTPGVDDVKYTTISMSATYTFTTYDYSGGGGGTPTVQTNDAVAVTQSIGATTGLNAYSGFSTTNDSELNLALGRIGVALWSWSQIVGRMTSIITIVEFGMTVVYSGSSITVTDADFGLVEQVDWDLAGGTFTRTVYDYRTPLSGPDFTPVQVVTTEESMSVSNGSLSYSLRNDSYGTPVFGGVGTELNSSEQITVSGSLGGENTGSAVYSDARRLLGLWDLADDSQYPWRTDLKVSLAPLVSRDEMQNNSFTTNFWVKNYGAPIADFFGRTLGDDGWFGFCGIVLAPDPLTGIAVVALDFPVTSGDVVNTAVGNVFSHCLATGYSIVGGSLPPGVSMDSAGVITGTAGATGHYGVTVEVSGIPATTGADKGVPLPAGTEDFFDFGYNEYYGCCFIDPANPGNVTWQWYLHGWGGTVGGVNGQAGCGMPLCATQWTNYWQAQNKPQGGFAFYADPLGAVGAGCAVSNPGTETALDAGALWLGKYAEVVESWNSEDYARPGGADKFLWDEDHVWCVANLSGAGPGSTWSVTDPISGLPVDDSADSSGTWGGPAVGGFYAVSSLSGGVVTLGAKAYDVPAGFASRSNGDEGQAFGRLRFPTAPSILGRAAVTPDAPTGKTFTFAGAEVNFGLAPTHVESVDLWDATMNPVAGAVVATRVDDATFTTPDPYPTARYATIAGAPKWYVSDSDPKGDLTLLTWTADLRTPGEVIRLTGVLDCTSSQVALPTANAGGGDPTLPFRDFAQTQTCLPFSPCGPKVAYCSPTTEAFTNSVRIPFPDSFALDEHYGSKWWASVQSTMTSLFWQRPHRPCNVHTCSQWIQDDGSCREDLEWDGAAVACPGDDEFVDGESVPPKYYYAFYPQVEARLTVPCAYGPHSDECAPTLPAGIQIGWLSPVTHAFGSGAVAFPPVPPGPLQELGIPGGATTSWSTHDLMCVTTAAGCRFDYATPGCS